MSSFSSEQCCLSFYTILNNSLKVLISIITMLLLCSISCLVKGMALEATGMSWIVLFGLLLAGKGTLLKLREGCLLVS